MLNIYLFEPDDEYREKIHSFFIGYSVKNNLEIEFHSENVSQPELSAERYTQNVSVYMLDGSLDIRSISIGISLLNPCNYIVIIADDINEILAGIAPEYRISGVIMKPVEYEQVRSVLNSICRDYKKLCAKAETQFRFRIRSREYCVALEKIMFLETLNKKMIMRTSGQAFEFYMSSEEAMKQLSDSFIRIHKSFIVNMAHISVADYKSMTVTLDDGSVILMSRTYKKELISAMERRRADDLLHINNGRA